jgi:hypothetical protein
MDPLIALLANTKCGVSSYIAYSASDEHIWVGTSAEHISQLLYLD